MAEYIEREALRDALYDADAITMQGVKLLNQLPAADVEPVCHGRWIVSEDEYGICATEFTCSNCKESYCTSESTGEEFLKSTHYCPNCGAKMR